MIEISTELNLLIEILLFSIMTAGILLMPLGIPGNFIAAIGTLLYFVLFGGAFNVPILIVFIGLALIGEAIEAVMGLLGAKKYGASKEGMWGAFLGGFIGAILGNLIIPVIGSFIGIFLGTFFGTLAVEFFIKKREGAEAATASMGALLGKIVAISTKMSFGLVILIISIWEFWLKDLF